MATTKFVAKLASTRGKPDGMLVVPASGVVAFLHPLPVGALWGVGEKTEKELTGSACTPSATSRTPRATPWCGPSGRPPARTCTPCPGAGTSAGWWPHEPDKSIGAEETFSRDVDDPDVVRRELLRLAERTAARLRTAGLAGRTVSVKIRFADFTTITRARTLSEPTDVAAVLYATARQLYEALGLDRARLRLVGIRVEGLVESELAPHQLLLGERAQGRREVEQAADRAARRFGDGTVRPASLVDPDRSTGSRE